MNLDVVNPNLMIPWQLSTPSTRTGHDPDPRLTFRSFQRFGLFAEHELLLLTVNLIKEQIKSWLYYYIINYYIHLSTNFILD